MHSLGEYYEKKDNVIMRKAKGCYIQFIMKMRGKTSQLVDFNGFTLER